MCISLHAFRLTSLLSLDSLSGEKPSHMTSFPHFDLLPPSPSLIPSMIPGTHINPLLSPFPFTFPSCTSHCALVAKQGRAAAGSYLAMLLAHFEDAIGVSPIALFML
ncbi:hypothetical protein GOODEAATRI_020380 [Goodea atripinnis]|uniref:Uncharacterized protein n=1 Tax=Goodea atripinnis TaxID=208336 RepID=A0ABV0NWD7_9TELE